MREELFAIRHEVGKQAWKQDKQLLVLDVVRMPEYLSHRAFCNEWDEDAQSGRSGQAVKMVKIERYLHGVEHNCKAQRAADILAWADRRKAQV